MPRKFLNLTAILLLLGAGESADDSTSTQVARLSRCLVSLVEEVEVPAQEPGQLIAVEAREGLEVEAGQLLAQIDDQQAQQARKLATIEHRSAQEKAINDVNVRYSKAASDVAEAEYDQALEANGKVRGTFPEAEVRRLKPAWDRAFLQIEQAQMEQRMAGHTSKVKAADVEAADNNIRRSQLVSPFDGEVVELTMHAGEWANPGDPVMRVVRFDTLRVEGFVDASQYDPSEIVGRPVTALVGRLTSRTARRPAAPVVVERPLVTSP